MISGENAYFSVTLLGLSLVIMTVLFLAEIASVRYDIPIRVAIFCISIITILFTESMSRGLSVPGELDSIRNEYRDSIPMIGIGSWIIAGSIYFLSWHKSGRIVIGVGLILITIGLVRYIKVSRDVAKEQARSAGDTIRVDP
jgi:hypothetical protein